MCYPRTHSIRSLDQAVKTPGIGQTRTILIGRAFCSTLALSRTKWKPLKRDAARVLLLAVDGRRGRVKEDCDADREPSSLDL
jgi:hypothetical protein